LISALSQLTKQLTVLVNYNQPETDMNRIKIFLNASKLLGEFRWIQIRRFITEAREYK